MTRAPRAATIRVVVLLTALIASPTPAGASHAREYPRRVTFVAPLPCAVACPYTLVPLLFPCHLECKDPPPVSDSPCHGPALPGTYDQITVTAPYWAELLVFEIFPEGDWDSFVCSPSGADLAIGTNHWGELCDNVVGPNSFIPLGCKERILLRVKPLQTIVLRAYNWLDGPTVPAQYSFVDLR